ncbi:hypothetical protein EDB85DRAFT_1951904 [Lactarius pseudohatsudake]|nr:hypothetical protein EDB85DRAFT_1951904 [Lactarius pseudohatsudake]
MRFALALSSHLIILVSSIVARSSLNRNYRHWRSFPGVPQGRHGLGCSCGELEQGLSLLYNQNTAISRPNDASATTVR